MLSKSGIAANTNYDIDYKGYKFLWVQVAMSNTGDSFMFCPVLPGTQWTFTKLLSSADARYQFDGILALESTYVYFSALSAGSGTGVTSKSMVIRGIK